MVVKRAMDVVVAVVVVGVVLKREELPPTIPFVLCGL